MTPAPDDNDALRSLQRQFAAAAAERERADRVIDRTIARLETLVRERESRERARYRDRVGAQVSNVKKLLDNPRQEGKPQAGFTVFVDHTGSMTQKPFYAALDAAGVLKNAAGASIALWGSSSDVRWVKDDILDPATRESFVKRGASSDFKPVVDEMIKTAALDRLEGRRSHFVVITDGEFADYPAAKAQLEKLFNGGFRATLDFVILGRAGTGMEFLSEQLAKDFPGKIRHHLANGPAYWQGTEEDLSREVQEKVAGIAKARLRETRKPRPKPTATLSS